LLALTCAADLHWTTRGRFDPTILETLEACGYDRSFEDVAAESDAPPRFHRPAGFRRVEIDEEQSRVRLPAGARIDLGGIGKGLAADLVARGLTERGARHVLLSLGGDVRAHGEPPAPAGWSIPVEDPCRPPRVAFEYSLRNGAIVTSTSRIRAWKRRGQACHHIIDPQSGMPAATGVVAVVAAGLDAWWAEGVAKAILVAGLESGVALAHAHAVRAWIYRPDGSFVDTGDA